jgi:hypothetical protein
MSNTLLRLSVAAIVLACGSAHAVDPVVPPQGPLTCKTPFRAMFEASRNENRGVTLFVGGQTIPGLVVACGNDGVVELKSQNYARIVVAIDRIDAAAMQ